MLFSEYRESEYGYVTLDDRAERMMTQNDPKGFLQLPPYPLIIDEVQYVAQLFEEITSIVNKKRLDYRPFEMNGMFILAGSQSFKLIKNFKESMSKRVGIINMTYLSMNEIQGRNDIAYDIDNEAITNRMKSFILNESNLYDYIIRGFFLLCRKIRTYHKKISICHMLIPI